MVFLGGVMSGYRKTYNITSVHRDESLVFFRVHGIRHNIDSYMPLILRRYPVLAMFCPLENYF